MRDDPAVGISAEMHLAESVNGRLQQLETSVNAVNRGLFNGIGARISRRVHWLFSVHIITNYLNIITNYLYIIVLHCL